MQNVFKDGGRIGQETHRLDRSGGKCDRENARNEMTVNPLKLQRKTDAKCFQRSDKTSPCRAR